MAQEIKTEIIIHARPEKVWSILTDFDNYPKWNPFIKSIKGDVKVGCKITVRIEPEDSKGMTFKPTVLKKESHKELSWLGHLLFPGLFDGEHKFELNAHENGTTIFRHNEKFKGILVPFLKKQLGNNIKKGFEEMNKKLKVLAENPHEF